MSRSFLRLNHDAASRGSQYMRPPCFVSLGAFPVGRSCLSGTSSRRSRIAGKVLSRYDFSASSSDLLRPRQLDVIPLQVGIERYDELSRRRGQVIYDRGRLYSSLVAYSPPQPAYGMRTWRPTYSRPCAASLSRADAAPFCRCLCCSVLRPVVDIVDRTLPWASVQTPSAPFQIG